MKSIEIIRCELREGRLDDFLNECDDLLENSHLHVPDNFFDDFGDYIASIPETNRSIKVSFRNFVNLHLISDHVSNTKQVIEMTLK